MNAVVTSAVAQDDLVDAREQSLGGLTLVLGVLIWLLLILGTFGIALLAIGAGALIYLFVHSALIAHLKGNGIAISETQFPEMHTQLLACCKRLQMNAPPQAYILNGNGLLNAFATHFLRTEYLVLTSDVVDAMQQNGEGLRFYMGHELGHLRRKHLQGELLRWPVLWLPLLGAAYSRARERTCDRHGVACCGSPEASVRALGALSAGRARWRTLNIEGYLHQSEQARGFWMSFHELVSGYPWLTKRAATIMGDKRADRRNPFAYCFAIFVPYGGRLGSGFSFLIMLYIIIIAGAFAARGYIDSGTQTMLGAVVSESGPVREKLTQYYLSSGKVPRSLEDAGVTPQLPDGSRLSVDEHMVLTVQTAAGEVVFVPSAVQGKILWYCTNGQGVRPDQLPADCQLSGGRHKFLSTSAAR